MQLTGEVGTGKTTLCRLLLDQLPENTRVALVLNPKLSPVELLETICEELKLDIAGKKGSLKALVDTLNIYLLDAYAQGLRVVLIVDEAQELSAMAWRMLMRRIPNRWMTIIGDTAQTGDLIESLLKRRCQ